MVDGPDADHDGILDAADGAPAAFGDANSPALVDTDGDGVPDMRDLDSDNDGIDDVIESGNGSFDVNGDGLVDGPDIDGDGVPDAVDGTPAAFGDMETTPLPDTDKDGVLDYHDLDSDNDGINDVIEGGNADLDANHDGLVDGPGRRWRWCARRGRWHARRVGDAGTVPPPDTDKDGVPDYHDLDSENDGIDDVIEGGNATLDANHDGIVDGTDADGDGISDAVDGAPAAFGDADDPATSDTDGDKVPDYRDLDSDNDGIDDVIEGGTRPGRQSRWRDRRHRYQRRWSYRCGGRRSSSLWRCG